MDISIEDMIDVEFLQLFQDAFSVSTETGALFFNKNLEAITKPSNFQEICSCFFRKCPKSSLLCQESDEHLIFKIAETKKPYITHCKNGLIDFGAPVILYDQVIGTLVAGQVLPKKADKAKFRNHAKSIGANEDCFMSALEKVPVVGEERIYAMLQMLTLVGEKLSELAYHGILLQNKNEMLENEIQRRILAEKNLMHLNETLEQRIRMKTKELTNSLESLQSMQKKLMENERYKTLAFMTRWIAHHLNTPLGILVSSQSLLRFDLETNYSPLHEDTIATLSIAEKNIERSIQIVESIKKIAQFDDGFKIEKVEIASFIKQSVRFIKEKYCHLDDRIQVDFSKPITLETNPSAIFQIIMIIMENAYMHAYDENDIKKIRIIIKKTHSKIQVEFRDFGKGISQEEEGLLFTPFFENLTGESKVKFSLQMARNLAKTQLDGDLYFKRPKKGAAFVLEITAKSVENGESK